MASQPTMNFAYFRFFFCLSQFSKVLTDTPLMMLCLGVLKRNFLGGKSGKCSGIDVELLISAAEEK